VIKHFAHVCRGICFRCWGTGTDMTDDIRGLRTWLTRARNEYAARLAVTKDPKAKPEAVAAAKREMSALAIAGKRNRKKLDAMVREEDMLRAHARSQSSS
jgi:hypothetical protein